ncbi:hypothetical protein MPSEU_000821600 [Mayamaea pseudoterrestris]|nr:hypothetical protein MPSEU_000821600 [Mayamaea pseudoterrestris]
MAPTLKIKRLIFDPQSLFCIFTLLLVLVSSRVVYADEEESDAELFNVSPPFDNLAASTLMSSAPSPAADVTTAATADSALARKQYWQRTFDEIRELRYNQTSRSMTQWKEYFMDRSSSSASSNSSSSNRKRFEGFVSWERLLQDWADDIQDYMEKEQEEGYPFSTYGMPKAVIDDASLSTLSADQNDTHKVLLAHLTTTYDDDKTSSTKQSTTPSLPVPKPATKGQAVLPHTDISDKSKHIWIVTTASLPWKTGTAVNPLLRAAYLCQGRKQAGGSVTLHLPWLERAKDQQIVYGADNVFESPGRQEDYLRTWLRESANMLEAADELQIEWYTAWQNKVENSIYSMGDITALIPEDKVDICILEEPEHLNWYRAPGDSWTKKFKHVVGILHTNYFQYALDQPAAIVRAPAMRLLCSWMCRAHCHRIIKLSATLEPVAPEKELVENVHGVRGTFIDTGVALRKRLGKSQDNSDPIFGATADPKIYFIGKMLWSKGLGSLMELLKFAEESTDLKVTVDMYGGGPDMKAAAAKAKKLDLDMSFLGPLDHAEVAFTHKIFVNPSTSEVLCTTSAEALAMGKFLILPSHPSNDFFERFPNCLAYTTKEEFVANLYYAITHEPEPLSEDYARALGWEAATERLAASACIPVEEAEARQETLDADMAAVEIKLPPLIEDEEGRQMVAVTLYKSRERYRLFRDKLAQEISQNKVLPKPVRERLLTELGKRLDIDIEEALTSPKLKLQLSPAELDSSLLELYEYMIDGPGGDLLRLIGGGGAVALQNLYLRRKVEKERLKHGWLPEVFPALLDEADDDPEIGPLQRIRAAMRKNIPQTNSQHRTPFTLSQKPGSKLPTRKSGKDSSVNMMSASPPVFGGSTRSSFSSAPPRRGSMYMSILI